MCFSTLDAHALTLLYYLYNVADLPISEGCIRGHRATTCEHFNRWMVTVKPPGRPLLECPHPKGPCPCRREKVMMVKIPMISKSEQILVHSPPFTPHKAQF